MNINGINHSAPRILSDNDSAKTNRKVKSSPNMSSGGDTVSILKFSDLTKIARDLPDTREEKIRAAKEKIKSGEYLTRDVAKDTAQAIIESPFSKLP